MSLQKPGLYIAFEDIKGRGVYTALPIKSGEIIESAPILLIPAQQVPIIQKTVIYDYYFVWGPENKEAVLALGFGSIYNHASDPNATFIRDYGSDSIVFQAIKDIEPGTEITINYHESPEIKDTLWFKEV